MKELNELAYRAKGYLRTKAESQPEQINASCEDILAIAEAFRALELENALLKQGCENDPLLHEMIDWKERAEAAEIEKEGAEERCRMMFDSKNHWADRARAAEAKLAELETQEPVLFRDSHGCFVSKGKGEQLIKSCEFVNPYYIRPAPAINLAELVQCPYPCGWSNLLSLSMADAAFLARSLIEDELVTETHRRSVVLNNDRLITVLTAILRKIDEDK